MPPGAEIPPRTGTRRLKNVRRSEQRGEKQEMDDPRQSGSLLSLTKSRRGTAPWSIELDPRTQADAATTMIGMTRRIVIKPLRRPAETAARQQEAQNEVELLSVTKN